MKSTAMARANERIATMRSSAMAKVQANRSQVRTAVSAAEIVTGATLAGYVDTVMPDGIGGVPASAGIGLVMLGVGFGMSQPDIAAIGLGAVCGQAYNFGRTLPSKS